jgi:glutamate-1-semialdehyde 2,1-aminomutase
MAEAETATGPQQTYTAGTRRSGQAFASARRRLPAGVSRHTLTYRPYPLFAERGAGQYLWDVDGNRYLDFVNNYTSLIHGHAHRPSVEAAIAELRRGGALGAPTSLELEFASLLIERFPVLERLRFALSGSEAITYALRVARAYTGRKRILKFEGGFHGAHDEVQQSIGSPPLRPGTFGSGVPSSAGLMDVSTLIAIFNDRDSVRAAFAAHGDEIAVVMAEPFLGNAGLITAAPGFLAFLREIAHTHGALLLLDEIQSMRLAYGGAQQLHHVTPDLVALGKIMGGGLPLAVLGGSEQIMAALDGFTPKVPQTGTFNAFSAALAAGMATMHPFDHDAISRLNDLGDRTRAGVKEVFRSAGIPVTVNGQGSMFNIILASGPVNRYLSWHAAPTDFWTAARLELLARGIYITARGTGCLSTPMDEANIDRFLTELHSVVHKIGDGRGRHVG